NVYPYLVGVFDTVAALLNRTMAFLLLCAFMILDLVITWILLLFHDLPLLGRLFAFFESFWLNFGIITGLTFVLVLAGYVYTHFKFDFGVPGYNWNQSLATMHWTELYQKFYDYTLNPNIPYGKHAISIDETRKDFRRVGWDPTTSGRPTRDQNGNIFFEQVWFPGNHADIGGGYEENESRLSDITLRWMLNAATSIPQSIKYDSRVLNTHPAPDGRRHDEVKTGFGLLTTLTGITWTEEHRKLPSNDAPMHQSVYERFDLLKAFEYDIWKPYRPETLRDHMDFAKYYQPDAS